MARVLFSRRYARAIRAGKLKVELPEGVRRRLWAAMTGMNHSYVIQRDPNDRWTDNTDIVSETALELRTEHAWERLPGSRSSGDIDSSDQVHGLVLCGPAEHVFDALETFSNLLDRDRREPFRVKVGQIFESEECPWRLLEGEFFKLDESFIGAQATRSALENLAGGRFAGAMDEYVKACREQASGEVKDAIADACKSYESVLKVLTGLGHVSADRLTKELAAQGWVDDLPPDVREGFRGAVLMSLPFLRNKLASHGQGADVVGVGAAYGTLALQLAAALANFLVTKQIERGSPNPGPEGPQEIDDLPF